MHVSARARCSRPWSTSAARTGPRGGGSRYDGTVYVVRIAGEGGIGDGELAALDAAGGTERWRFGPGGFLSPSVAADGTVFVHTGADQATLDAIDHATGTERSRLSKTARAFSETFPALAVAAEVAYVGSGETIYALDAASGARRWRSRLALALPETTPEGDSSPVAGS